MVSFLYWKQASAGYPLSKQCFPLPKLGFFDVLGSGRQKQIVKRAFRGQECADFQHSVYDRSVAGVAGVGEAKGGFVYRAYEGAADVSARAFAVVGAANIENRVPVVGSDEAAQD